jgi:hypothetical protein
VTCGFQYSHSCFGRHARGSARAAGVAGSSLPIGGCVVVTEAQPLFGRSAMVPTRKVGRLGPVESVAMPRREFWCLPRRKRKLQSLGPTCPHHHVQVLSQALKWQWACGDASPASPWSYYRTVYERQRCSTPRALARRRTSDVRRSKLQLHMCEFAT